MPRPSKKDLAIWLEKWRTLKKAAYRRLIDSYTPEQREIVREMMHYQRQVRLCKERLARPNSSLAGLRGPDDLLWPDPPPTKTED